MPVLHPLYVGSRPVADPNGVDVLTVLAIGVIPPLAGARGLMLASGAAGSVGAVSAGRAAYGGADAEGTLKAAAVAGTATFGAIALRRPQLAVAGIAGTPAAGVAAADATVARSPISLPILNPGIPAEFSVRQVRGLITVDYGNLGTISGRGTAAYGKIYSVAVHPTFQGMGLGTELYGRLLPEIGNPLIVEGVPGGVNEAILETAGKTILDTPRAKILGKFGYDIHTYNPRTAQMTSSCSGG